MRYLIRVMLAALALGAVLATAATAAPRDTTVRTIRDTDGDNLLEYAPGEDYTYLGPAARPRLDPELPPAHGLPGR
jgi:hypothetical protein